MRKILSPAVFFLFFLVSTNLQAQQWVSQTNPLGFGEDAMLGNVHFVSSTEGWIVSKFGHFLHTTNGGEQWTDINPFPNDTVQNSCDPDFSMSWIGSTHGWNIATLGTTKNPQGAIVDKTTDGGATWQRVVLLNGAGESGVKLQFIDIKIGFALIYNFTTGVPTFLKTTDGGNNWFSFNCYGIFHFIDENTGWCYYGSGVNGQDPPFKILKTTNGGTDWVEQFSDNTIGVYEKILFIDKDHGWLLSKDGKLIKTTDGGSNWGFLTVPGGNQDKSFKVLYFLNENTGWISTKLNSLGSVPVVYHTTDGGANWETQYTPFNNNDGYNSIFSVYFIDANTGWLTADWGRIAKYTGTTDIKNSDVVSNSFYLDQNYPNPFNPTTSINYSVKEEGIVTLKIFDVLGNELFVLINEVKPAGQYNCRLDMSSFANGVYIYKLQSGSFTAAKKMIVLK